MSDKILITGGTGFLGRRLAAALKARGHEVVLGARNNKQNFAAAGTTGCTVLPLEVASIESVRDAVCEVKPDVIIHAAATKFVDLAERQPMECVDVNVVGSQNVARVAVDKGVSRVIGISTDKAAPPIRNIYGLSKAVMERLFCSMNGKSKTLFTCVRYGNVAWSTGSVLTIWKKMHEKTKVIQSTGPDMTRFFFTVDEAVALVLTGLDRLQEVQGRVLSREMKAARIRDILDIWTQERGGRWEKIEGRPGDRAYEHLIGESELEHAVEKVYDGIKHYVVSLNEKASKPLPAVVSSDSAERLTPAEISELIAAVPEEEAS